MFTSLNKCNEIILICIFLQFCSFFSLTILSACLKTWWPWWYILALNDIDWIHSFQSVSSQCQPWEASAYACSCSAVCMQESPWWALFGLWTSLPAEWEQRYSWLPGAYRSIWHTRLRTVAQWQPLLVSVRECVCVRVGLGIWESSGAEQPHK